MEVIANNYEHNLPQYKQCTCGDDMKLSLKEDKQANITYIYTCLLEDKYCDKVEIIENTGL